MIFYLILKICILTINQKFPFLFDNSSLSKFSKADLIYLTHLVSNYF